MNTTIKQFNSIVEDLLQQTTSLLGTKYLFNFKTLLHFNYFLPIDKFTSTMLPYKHYIMTKNASFFMNKDVSLSEYANININNNDIIDLKKIFMNIDNESKDNIWETLQALIILCEERQHYSIKNKTY